MKQPWSHLHGHSHYSLRDGLGTVSEIVNKAAELGFESICLTDHGTAAGWFDLWESTNKVGIKPLYGCELYVCDDRTWHGVTTEEEAAFKSKNGRKMSTEEKAVYTKDKGRSYHLVAHAMNDVGVRNLSEIVSNANIEGFYKVPRTDWKYLEQHNEGVFVTTACLGGVLSKPLIFRPGGADSDIVPDEERYNWTVQMLNHIFPGRWAFEIQVNDSPEQKLVNQRYVQDAKRLGIPFVITQDFHYPAVQDARTHDYVKMMDYNIKAKDWVAFSHHTYNLCDYNELWAYWCKNGHDKVLDQSVFLEACANTKMIEQMLNPKIDYSTPKIPLFPLPEGIGSSKELLMKLATEGWQRRYPMLGRGPYRHTPEQYWAQFLKEVDVIEQMGYIDYFLIVQDFVMWAKRNGLAVGPARGSAGGSVLSWFLGITEIDPLRFRLVFERFLNPERKKMPDIDSDFSDEARPLVKQYLAEKWGEENCASIAAYSRYSAKSVLQDIARLHDINDKEVNTVTKALDPNDSIEKSLAGIPVLKTFLEKHKLMDVLPVIQRLQGCIRHVTQAAAGMLISDKPLQTMTTLRRQGGGAEGGKSTITTEVEGDKLGDAGFLKMDVLGIRELSSLSVAAKSIGKDLDWLYQEIAGGEMDDQKVWEAFKKGDTLAVFQFGSEGMKELLRNVKPDNIMELAAVSALYRPQTLKSGVADAYWKRKHGQEQIRSIHPLVDDLFKDTFGLQVFQEQFIAAAERLGLSYGEADILRRTYEDVVKPTKAARAKPKLDALLGKMKAAGKLPSESLDEVMKTLGGEVGYSFNVAHSVAYSILAYFGQYLKVHHPEAYWPAMMNVEMNNNRNGRPVPLDPFINRLANHFKAQGKQLTVYIGNINSFCKKFTLSYDANGQPWLYFGIEAVKGIGEKTIDALGELVSSRNKPYGSVQDFMEHYAEEKVGRAITSGHIRTLIEIGFFDGLPLSAEYNHTLNRLQLVEWFELWNEVKGTKGLRLRMYAGGNIGVKRGPGKTQKDKRTIEVPTINVATTCNSEDIKALELKNLSTIISGSTVRKFAHEIEFMRQQFAAHHHEQDMMLVGGMLIEVKEDDKKLILTVFTDDSGPVDITAWHSRFRRDPLQLEINRVYAFVCERKGKWLDLRKVTPLSVETQRIA